MSSSYHNIHNWNDDDKDDLQLNISNSTSCRMIFSSDLYYIDLSNSMMYTCICNLKNIVVQNTVLYMLAHNVCINVSPQKNRNNEMQFHFLPVQILKLPITETILQIVSILCDKLIADWLSKFKSSPLLVLL